MNFNSAAFLGFLIIAVLVYYLLPHKGRNVWLLFCSYYFYMCWNVKYSLLMLFTTLISYTAAILLDRFGEQKRKCLLVTGTVLLTGMLCIFKYLGFIIENVNLLMTHVGLLPVDVSLNLLLPVGISFYVIQSIGYLIDVYRKDIPAERNLIIFMLFVSFFPQLVAGPIERAANMLPQFREKHTVSAENLADGMRLILFGLFKKVAIADVCALYVNAVFDNLYAYSGLTLVLAGILFTVQIYGDFSGYSDIARGSGRLLGFRLMENFRAPYLADSPGDFWNRWHVSLSQWLRDYIYIPLGGSRSGNVYINTMIVFFASGLWHGAAWRYIYWGGVWGIAVCVQRCFLKRFPGVCRIRRKARIGMMWIVIAVTMLMFRADGPADLFYILKSIFTGADIASFLSQLAAVEQAMWFRSVTFACWMVGTLLVNVAVLFWMDCRYDSQMKNGGLTEHVLSQVRERRRTAVYVWMLFQTVIWYIVQMGSYVSGADFIYFQF